MEKLQLVNFIAKVMEDSGFKVYKDFKTSQKIIDIYGVLPTVMGDFGVVVACKNYDKQWEVGVDILKEMEMVGRNLKASKVTIVTSSSFSSQARNYGSRKNIKLVDRDNLMALAKKFSKKGENIDNNAPFSDSSAKNTVNPSNSSQNYPNISNGTMDNIAGTESRMKSSVDQNPTHGNSHDDTTYIPKGSNSNLGRTGTKSGASYSSKSGPVSPSSKSKRSGIFGNKNLNKTRKEKQGPPLSEMIKPILNNTIVLIILVVAISYFIAYIFGSTSGASNGVEGLIKIISSLALSYGLVLVLNREGTIILVKGTTVFFISLVILILMIILL